MSKNEGRRIAIKFTENLVGDVSGKVKAIGYKHYRWYVTSTWSGSRLYLYELEIFGGGKIPANHIIDMQGSSRYSTSYDVDNLFDGTTNREWDANGSLPHWCRIELNEPVVIDSFKWNTNTGGNKPRNFKLQGSTNGSNWIDIFEGESPNINNWIEFIVEPLGNEAAFIITGKERKHINGELIDREYKPINIERHPIGDNAILLIFGKLSTERFNNVEDALTVSYNSNLGKLTGMGGSLESFDIEFISEGLIRKPNPYILEKIEVLPFINVDFINVTYNQRYGAEKITAKPNMIVDFINVDEVNP